MVEVPAQVAVVFVLFVATVVLLAIFKARQSAFAKQEERERHEKEERIAKEREERRLLDERGRIGNLFAEALRKAVAENPRFKMIDFQVYKQNGSAYSVHVCYKDAPYSHLWAVIACVSVHLGGQQPQRIHVLFGKHGPAANYYVDESTIKYLLKYLAQRVRTYEPSFEGRVV